MKDRKEGQYGQSGRQSACTRAGQARVRSSAGFEGKTSHDLTFFKGHSDAGWRVSGIGLGLNGCSSGLCSGLGWNCLW